MNSMVVQTNLQQHPHHEHFKQAMAAAAAAAAGGPGSPGCPPNGMVGLNSDMNHVKRPMNAFMVCISVPLF